MLEEAERERKHKDYVAVTQTNIAKLLAAYLGADLKMPNYIELMYPEMQKKAEKTGQEIIDDLVKRLLGQ